ncbi:hypothetical protein [Kocuria marina]|uniref:hypothetical protein n=1 Tax=Kocuria marina TaxID=223184 RepID=UPI00223BF5E9|nr:hypothetical protein [Kocuria marina]MCT1615106.1 hypothetical protein [Kocuria marina]
MKSEQQTVRVWVNGSVYSPADPFATAVLLDGATVAWVGSDDAARAMAGADVTPGDLRAAVVTPAFVAHHRVDGSRELPRAEHGYGAVELLSSDPDALDAATREVRADGLHALPVLVRRARDTEQLDPSALPSPALGFDAAPFGYPAALADAAREHLVACTRAGLQAVLVLPPSGDGASEGGPSGDGSSEEGSAGGAPSDEGSAGTAGPDAASSSGDPRVDALLDAADAAAKELGGRAFHARGHRIVGVERLSEAQCERLAGLAITVSCQPGRAPLRDLSRAGVPVTLMTDDPNPWTAVKAALEAPDEHLRTSARAAFLALTRGVWRAHRGGTPLAGQLAPGAEATLAVWDAESVMVQQAQGTGASWSTDPRARTPVLPALDDSRLPRCEATVVAGALVSGVEPRP